MKLLVIDDSTLFRNLISQIVSVEPGIDIVGRARDGNDGIEKIRMLKPDIITLDLEMPILNGLEVMDLINKENLGCGVIVISSHSRVGSLKTIKALQKGAFDFITKPDDNSPEINRIKIAKKLIPLLNAWGTNRKKKSIKTMSLPSRISPVKIPSFLAIGSSTGGPEALMNLIPQFKSDFPVPIVIAQHMPPLFTNSLAKMLNKKSQLKVLEAFDNMDVLKGYVYIAPGGYHMKIIKVNGKAKVKITDDPPEKSCKPSVNYLFRSLANNFPGKTVALILTGMGDDGTLGVKLLKRHGCFTVAQDEDSSIVYGMPKQIIDEGLSDIIVPLDKIANVLQEVIK